MRTPFGLVVLLAAALLLGPGCSGVGPFEPGTSAGEILVTPINPVLGAIGATQQLDLALGDAADIIDDQTIQWTSSAPGVARVDGAGLVTAVADGTAVITARWNGIQGTTTVTVDATILTTFRVSAAGQADGTPGNNSAAASITVTAD